LRLYQQELFGQGIPRGRRHPVRWTLRLPYRPLTYHAARRMFERANAVLGADWTHDLRHSAATRMAHDPQLSLTDVQWVLGHAHLTTTQPAPGPSPRAPGSRPSVDGDTIRRQQSALESEPVWLCQPRLAPL